MRPCNRRCSLHKIVHSAHSQSAIRYPLTYLAHLEPTPCRERERETETTAHSRSRMEWIMCAFCALKCVVCLWRNNARKLNKHFLFPTLENVFLRAIYIWSPLNKPLRHVSCDFCARKSTSHIEVNAMECSIIIIVASEFALLSHTHGTASLLLAATGRCITTWDESCRRIANIITLSHCRSADGCCRRCQYLHW